MKIPHALANFFKPSRRTRLLINPPFQLRFTLHILLYTIYGITVLYLSNAYFLYSVKQSGAKMDFPSNHPFVDFLDEHIATFHLIFFITSIIVILAISLMGLVFSHRIAGPMYRFCLHLDNTIKTGNIEEVKFREDDFFPEVADKYNQAIKCLKGNCSQKTDPTEHTVSKIL